MCGVWGGEWGKSPMFPIPGQLFIIKNLISSGSLPEGC